LESSAANGTKNTKLTLPHGILSDTEMGENVGGSSASLFHTGE